jgi:hypothetical protein
MRLPIAYCALHSLPFRSAGLFNALPLRSTRLINALPLSSASLVNVSGDNSHNSESSEESLETHLGGEDECSSSFATGTI